APGAGVAGGYRPTEVSGQVPPHAASTAAGFGPAAPGAYGYPQQRAQQHPQPPPAYGPPQPSHQYGGNPYAGGALGPTPPYGPAPFGAPPEPEQRHGRSTALLVVIALVAALGAGGTVYALMNRGGGDKGAGTVGPAPTATSAPPASSTAPTPSPSPPASSATGDPDGIVPSGYLGTWNATIDNTNGTNTRVLTIRQGAVGDSVLTLVADGPTAGGGSYHCVFEARLTQDPGAGGPLRIGPSTVTSGRPASSCTPGDPTEITLLPDGRLKRATQDGGESLTYSRR
ncbi:serine/threonine protein kinase, partial [Streptomyces sp. AF1A]